MVKSMHGSSLLLGAMAALTVSGMARADATWISRSERGLPVIRAETAKGALQVTCDPDRVFGPTPNGSVKIDLPQDADPQMIVFLARDGAQARLSVQGGIATQAATDPQDWAKMVAMLQAGGTFAVVSSKDSLTFDMPALPDLACN